MSTHTSKRELVLVVRGVVLGHAMGSATPRALGGAQFATLLVQRIPYDTWCLVGDALGKSVSLLGSTILGGASW